MKDVLFLVTVPLVYAVAYVALQTISNGSIWLGSLLNKASHRPQAPDKNMWLFSMLIGITKHPTLILGVAAYVFWLLGYVGDNPLYTLGESFAILGFGAFLVIRIICLFIGGVLFGDSIKGILHSLNS